MHKAALLATTGLFPAGAILMAAGDIETLQADADALLKERDDILAAADGGDLNDDQLKRLGEIKASIERIGRQIEARQPIDLPGPGRRSTPDALTNSPAPAAPRQSVPAGARQSDPRGGFRNFGDFAVAVRNHAAQRFDDEGVRRLNAAATTYGSEGVGSDGGFAVPAEFRRDIWQKVMGEDNLLTRCDQLQTGSNNLTVPKDETTPWQTTGGIQVYWEGEAQAATASKPLLQMETVRLAKLMALVPVSEELLADAPGLESWLRAKAPAKMTAKINTAIVDGTGVGQPQGILGADCTITVAKETSQPADSLWGANITKMWGRMYAPCRRNAVWLINQDCEPALDLMGFAPLGASAATVAAATAPLYIPAGGLSASPYATLKGRPVIPVEACKTLGDKGDIMLVDLSQYMALTRAGENIKTDVSMHLYFDQALMAFRFQFRVNGQPWWGKAIDPQNGTNTRSCFVTLAERG